MEQRHRLASSREFQRVMRSGSRTSTGSFVLLAAPSPHPAAVRVGVTATRSLGGAVARNRAKRRLREAVRRQLHLIRKGTDLVVVARPGALSRNFQTLVDDVAEAARKVGAC